MKTKLLFRLLFIVVPALLLFSCKKRDFPPLCSGGNDSTVTTQTVFATGLNDPRGLKFGPDGKLYVAEAGIGGTNTYTPCAPVVPPVGPYMGSDTGSRISQVDAAGNRTTYVDHLPSSVTSPMAGSGINGVADVAFIGNTLYAIFAGAGCSHAVPDIPNGVIKIKPDRSWKMIANLSEFQMNNPVKKPNPGDFEPDGTWWSMINWGGNLYAVEPNHGELDKITPAGNVSRVIDVSAAEGHIVPTALVAHNGIFYISNLDVFPVVPGSSSVFQVTQGGQIKTFATGFTNVLGLAFDNHDRLYVLETNTAAGGLTPGTGDIVRIDAFGTRQIIAKNLNFPAAMTFGPDGKLYVSVWGIGPPGLGQIVQIGFKCEVVCGDNYDKKM
ncbi:MAG: ScyD/ScyE family protein [Bacteroidota bacterium]|nr:ScyD/ScyE family protein [Bacteroidota bacterium]